MIFGLVFCPLAHTARGRIGCGTQCIFSMVEYRRKFSEEQVKISIICEASGNQIDQRGKRRNRQLGPPAIAINGYRVLILKDWIVQVKCSPKVAVVNAKVCELILP